MVLSTAGEVGEAGFPAVDCGVRLGSDGFEQHLEQLVGGGAVAVAVANEETAEVDQGLQCELGCGRIQWPGGAEGAELLLAQGPRRGQAARSH